MTDSKPKGPVLLGRDDLSQLGITYSNTHLLRLEAAGQFPKRLYLSPGRVAWLKSEVDAWIEDRAAEREHRVCTDA